MTNHKKAAVIATGWMGDSIACTAAATSLHDKGYEVSFYTRWPQLKPILDNDKRYKTIVYGKLISHKIQRPLFKFNYELIIREPEGWSYEEPFTSQIRRMANCEPNSEYQLNLSEIQIKSWTPPQKPFIAISRDLYKRSYGRDLEDLINRLSMVTNIIWVGLDPNTNSKQGKNKDLVIDAAKIYHSDLFIGPEGGMLWLAAGLGKTCIYFSEHIEEICRKISKGNPRITLGSKNHFPNQPHVCLPNNCSNQYVEKIIKEFLSN